MALRLDDLDNETSYLTPAEKRARGFQFERYLYDAFEEDKLRVQRPYKGQGEQIDGGFFLDGRWYLTEAKWHAKELPASELYAFKGKVEGKLTGTCGFFISWSGYSEDCADALAFGKSINVLLCDAEDVRRAESVGWTQVFREKLQRASLFGDIYWTPPSSVNKASGVDRKSPVVAEFYVEGKSDLNLVRELMKANFPNVPATIYEGHGKLRAARLASTLPKKPHTVRFLVVDSDGNPNTEQELSAPRIDAVIVFEPEMEALFFPQSNDPRAELQAAAAQQKVPAFRWVSTNIGAIDPDSMERLLSRIRQLLPSADRRA